MDNKFGSWNSNDLQKTLPREINDGQPLVDTSIVSDWDRFKITVVHEIRRYFLEINTTEIASCIFLLNTESFEPREGSLINFSKTNFLSRGRINFSGKVFVSNLAVQRGYYFEHNINDLDDLLNILIEENLNNKPCILLDCIGETKDFIFFPNGLESDSDSSIPFDAKAITEQDIYDVFKRIHESSLCTPHALSSADCKIWDDAQNWLPSNQVEKKIQGTLYSALSVSFQCESFTLPEVSVEDGRLDFLLVSKSGKGKLDINAVVELKALRSFSQGNKSYTEAVKQEWIEKGMRQVIAYSDKFSPIHSILSCYDMSKKEYTDEYWFANTSQQATEKNIKQWRWRLYNSSETKRSSEIK